MTIWNAILLGLVQGIAEFLPISSSGHLSILQNLFGLSTAENGHLFFDVLLHLGTLASVCVVYWADIRQMVRDCLDMLYAIGHPEAAKGGRMPGARLALMIVTGTLPLVLILPVHSRVEELYNHTIFIGLALMLTGCMLYVSDKMIHGKKTGRTMRVRDALLIGLCQAIATIPGLSRSGTTITAGVATGLDRSFAVKFSFLLSIPAVLGANLLSLVDAIGEGVEWSYMPAYLIGTVVAAVTGIAAIRLLKFITAKGGFGKFCYYCWGAGFIAVVLTIIL